MIKSASVIPLRKCPVCGGPEVMSFYMEDRKYRYTCCTCGQYFEFNARSQAQADHMWNELFKR
jgi:transcription elongation factor Elf1